MVLNTETEQKIVASAEKLFYQKGKAGTSMQDIADDAGINRPLLNYYFRSKDKLFEAVFRNALSSFVPDIAAILNSDVSFEIFVQNMIETVIDTMVENPQIPIFILQELSSNPERMPQMIREMGIDPALAMKKIEVDRNDDGKVWPDPKQLIINLLSLCIFPFAARPVFTEILFNGDESAYLASMRQRKEILPGMFMQLMKQNQ
jgi:TetR/AcrR family transcriptional regulator